MQTQRPASKIIRFFITKDETRLRAAWRLLLHTLLIFVFASIAGFIAGLGLIISGVDFTDPIRAFPKYLEILITLPPILLGTIIARTVLDRRSFSSLGLKINLQSIVDLIVGFVIAALMMGLIFLIEWSLGWLKVSSFAWDSSTTTKCLLGILGGLGYFFAIGFQEELIFRGYQLQNLIESLDLTKGLIISSLFFTLAHIFNPHSSLLSTLGLFISGLFLAFGWVRTQQLWLPIGLHIGWNFFEGVVFGFPVSGTETFRLINHNISGPTLFTGGDFGPEAGLVLLPALALGIFLIWFYTKSRPQKEEDPSLADLLFKPHITK